MTFQVTLPSGQQLEVMTDEEVDFAQNLIKGYQDAFDLTHVSDVEDLNKIVSAEILIARWNAWLNSGKTYTGANVSTKEYAGYVDVASKEVRQLKKALGIDKVQRDKTRGEDSVPHYIASLLERAQHFGITRNKQAAKSHELGMQLISMQQAADNMTQREQEMFSLTPRDIVDWIRDTFTPELLAIDEAFQQEQKTWITKQ